MSIPRGKRLGPKWLVWAKHQLRGVMEAFSGCDRGFVYLDEGGRISGTKAACLPRQQEANPTERGCRRKRRWGRIDEGGEVLFRGTPRTSRRDVPNRLTRCYHVRTPPPPPPNTKLRSSDSRPTTSPSVPWYIRPGDSAVVA